MEKLLPLLILLFSSQQDKTPQFTEQCKAFLGSEIFNTFHFGKWNGRDLAKMIDTMQSLQNSHLLEKLQKGEFNINILTQLCNLFNIQLPKGLDFHTISNLSNLARVFQMQQPIAKEKNIQQNHSSMPTNPFAPIIQIANADIIYILTNYFSR